MDKNSEAKVEEEEEENTDNVDCKVVYKLRDISKNLVKAWEDVFDPNDKNVQISCGDIFKGGPQADAIVSPANSFGYMDGGIDQVYLDHFGRQMQTRLQKIIRDEYDGENLVGNSIIMPAYEESSPPSAEDLERCNEGQPIKFLISAPTMRVPLDVSETPNAYLAFRSVILAVQKHNKNPSNIPIRSVLCPGLGTAVGMMPFQMCAYQMLQAYQLYGLRLTDDLWKIHSKSLLQMQIDHDKMVRVAKEKPKSDKESSKGKPQENAGKKLPTTIKTLM